MVPPAKIGLLLTLVLLCCSRRERDQHSKMGTEISDDMHGTVADYPGEDPSELEHKTAMENLERLLRHKDLLGFTLAVPVKTAEYADYAALPMPLSATDAVQHGA